MSEIKVSDGKDLITYTKDNFHLCVSRKYLPYFQLWIGNKYACWDNMADFAEYAATFDRVYPGLLEFLKECHGVNGYWVVG